MPFDIGLERTKEITLLRTARDLLARDGWCVGMWRNKATGARCLLTALDTAWLSDPVNWRRGVYRSTDPVFAAALRLLGFSAPQEAVNFNDTPGRTKEEIISLFDTVLGAD